MGLTTEQVGELARKSLDNSVALLDEAEGLASFGKYARGYALGILAAEEFGKFMMCFRAMTHQPEETEFWRDFWRRATTHDPKYENAFGWAVLGLPEEESKALLADLTKHARTDQARKMAAFYVDVADDGVVSSPTEVIDPEVALGALAVFDRVIRSTVEVWGDADFTQLFRQGLEAGAADVAKAVEAGDTEAVEEHFRRLRSGKDPES